MSNVRDRGERFIPGISSSFALSPGIRSGPRPEDSRERPQPRSPSPFYSQRPTKKAPTGAWERPSDSLGDCLGHPKAGVTTCSSIFVIGMTKPAAGRAKSTGAAINRKAGGPRPLERRGHHRALTHSSADPCNGASLSRNALMPAAVLAPLMGVLKLNSAPLYACRGSRLDYGCPENPS